MKRAEPGLILFFLMFIVLNPSCSRGEAKTAIRIGVLPDSCVLPLYLMDSVEVVPFMSARERDTALQAGELDGVMTDLVAVTSQCLRGEPLKVFSLTESRFVIIGNEDIDPEAVWTVGISEHTVIEYLVDRMTEGLAVEKLAIPKVPLRMEMLKQGKVSLVCITDAMAWPLLSEGFVILKDQREFGLDPAVLAFSDKWLKTSAGKLVSLANQWNNAVDTIMAAPDAYRDRLISLVRLPVSAAETYPMPTYRHITLPRTEEVESVFSWYAAKYGQKPDLKYADVVIK